MSGDRDTYRTLTALSVLVVALIAAAVSYLHIFTLAERYGQPEAAAIMLPISIDGAVCTSSLAMLRSARLDISAPWLARGMLVLAVGATLACNVAYGLPHGWPGALLSGWPAVAFIGSAEVAISMSRRAQLIAPASEPVPEQPEQRVMTEAATPAHDPLPVVRTRKYGTRRKGKSRRGGSLADRQARRAALEAEAMTILAAEPGSGLRRSADGWTAQWRRPSAFSSASGAPRGSRCPERTRPALAGAPQGTVQGRAQRGGGPHPLLQIGGTGLRPVPIIAIRSLLILSRICVPIHRWTCDGQTGRASLSSAATGTRGDLAASPCLVHNRSLTEGVSRLRDSRWLAWHV
jgi:Protein of unknown function (DUF2637)